MSPRYIGSKEDGVEIGEVEDRMIYLRYRMSQEEDEDEDARERVERWGEVEEGTTYIDVSSVQEDDQQQEQLLRQPIMIHTYT
jgi:hypothetical protein